MCGNNHWILLWLAKVNEIDPWPGGRKPYSQQPVFASSVIQQNGGRATDCCPLYIGMHKYTLWAYALSSVFLLRGVLCFRLLCMQTHSPHPTHPPPPPTHTTIYMYCICNMYVCVLRVYWRSVVCVHVCMHEFVWVHVCECAVCWGLCEQEENVICTHILQVCWEHRTSAPAGKRLCSSCVRSPTTQH